MTHRRTFPSTPPTRPSDPKPRTWSRAGLLAMGLAVLSGCSDPVQPDGGFDPSLSVQPANFSDCTDFPGNNVTGRVGNLFVPANTGCTISETGVVNGHLVIGDGTSTIFHGTLVLGTVTGKVDIVGPEAGPGLVLLAVVGGARINGNITATGNGTVDTIDRAQIHGNITSNLRIGFFGDVGPDIRGNVISTGSGEGVGVFAPGTEIRGNIKLLGSGEAFVSGLGSVTIHGNIHCKGAGSDSNIPLSSVTGKKHGCPTQ